MIPEDRFELYVSVALALEYEEVLQRPGMTPDVSAQETGNFLDYILQRAHLEPSVARLRPVLPDRDDERILELAAQSNAIIVTHNVRDFEGARRFGVEVKTPGEVLASLRKL